MFVFYICECVFVVGKKNYAKMLRKMRVDDCFIARRAVSFLRYVIRMESPVNRRRNESPLDDNTVTFNSGAPLGSEKYWVTRRNSIEPTCIRASTWVCYTSVLLSQAALHSRRTGSAIDMTEVRYLVRHFGSLFFVLCFVCVCFFFFKGKRNGVYSSQLVYILSRPVLSFPIFAAGKTVTQPARK